MKKLFLVSIFFIVSAGLVFSQNITVTSHSSGNTWNKGNSYTVTWTKSGAMNANVKLTLRNADGSLNSVITMSTPNDGSFSWLIPGSVSPGNYEVRVKTVDNAVFDNSAQFSIAATGASINITSPSGPYWCKGQSKLIQWTKSGSMSANVKITLRNGDGSLNSVITMSTANDGSYSWAIPPGLSSGTYKIRVKTVDNAVADDSVQFQIKSCASPGTPCHPFIVFKPQINGIGFIGHKLGIKWGNLVPLMKKKNINSASNRIDSIGEAGLFNKLKMVKIEIKNVKCPAPTPITTEQVRNKYLMRKVPAKSIVELMKRP